MFRWACTLLTGLLLAACEPGLISIAPDGGSEPAGDASPAADDASPGGDARPDGLAPDVRDPCSGVDCSGHGTCRVSAGQASCACDPGYHADGLTCVPDDPCANVTCGQNAHCESGSCVCDEGYEGDPATGCRLPNPTEAQVRQELVDIALAEVGECEDGVDDKPYMLGQPGYWCYDFVAWVYGQSSHPLPPPMSLPQHPASEVPDQFLPEPGDLIKFTIQHYGMVRSVSADGQTIDTVEGNVNSCVVTRTVSLSRIEYFGSLETYLNN